MESEVVHSDPGVLGGVRVFVGTRVPVRILWEHLEAGDSLEDFLEGFPSVKREQAVRVIQLIKENLPSAIGEIAS